MTRRRLSGDALLGKRIGIGDATDGLLILNDEVKIGKNIREVLDLDDQVLEIKSTPDLPPIVQIAYMRSLRQGTTCI